MSADHIAARVPSSAPPAPRARTRTMTLIAIAGLGAFLILLVVGVVPRVSNHRALGAAAARARSAVPGVQVLQPVPESDADLVLAGTTQAIQDAVIYARTSGYLSKRYVDIGDRVRAGQLLAEIASPEVEQQLSQSRANLRQSERNLDLQKASLDLARITMDRYKAADAEKAVAIEALDQSVGAFRTAQAAVAAAEANVESNRANVRQLEQIASFQRVLAPFSGTIIQRNVDVGALITAGSPTDNTAVAPTSVTGAANGLFEVAQADRLRVFVNVPQAFAPNVRAGLPVSVTVRGQREAPVAASVTRTSSALDPGTRTLLTQVDIPNPSGRLLPGMFVYVTFTIAPSGTRWRVPATAVIFDAQGSRVAIVGPQNKVHFLPVEIGRDFGDAFDVQAGLQGHERIIRQPTVALQEGQVVRPIASAPTPSS
ncbi:MAG TPA: efflux RND transporter periplasmic adaptor subunit [Vicinamibacteria bacterium]|nr:efflux RND transporter periplasmic adaptor subunit [Vicinamibacteria bacterium]